MIDNNNLVIFDCDGVLVDSEHLAAQVFSQTLADYGIAWSAQQCMTEFKGLTLTACLQKLNCLTGESLPENFLSVLNERTAQCFADQLKPVAGVEQVINKLQENGIAFCVASNGSLAKIQRSLSTTGLIHYFQSRLFSAEQVNSGKPAPDLFILAAHTMGFDSSQCWVVEDSAAGFIAAQRAKMRLISYQPEPQSTAEAAQTDSIKPDIVLDKIEKMMALIK